ncbi:MAG TPA: hypothetical protein VFP98_05475, partial [Candidatus Polarisedimenticolia bacterium]|nr:hypothetical protein [Candidatus Polarisedimenticolia bacterium]
MAAPPAPVGDARRAGLERAFSAGILLAGIAVWTGFRAYTRITLEDALITFRYAANLAEGLGFVYNAGERVLGTTTPLFTLLLGGIGALAGPDRVP